MTGAAIVLLLSIAAGGMVFVYHTLYVQTTPVHLSHPRMPPSIFIHITDLHGRTRFLNGTLHRLVNRWRPDMIFVTGDLTQNRDQLANVMREIAKLVPKDGIFFVPGNYEREELRGFQKRNYTGADYAASKKQWQTCMKVLENQDSIVRIGDTRMRIYGFDNSTYGFEQYHKEVSDEQADCTVLLAHSPSIISYIRANGVHADLLLTGHTHGGQIRLLGKTLGPYRHFHVGIKKDDHIGLFAINRGLGTSRIPLRFCCFPEITVFLINQQKSSA
ncbi:metallophosphoesterase [Brevibacillus centrosporus]|uniref:metallophosphoesterase n=1 Tax=Brevibacillus centrosporus TaxID=54910 RepID=UPI002E201CA2|nr:metallophosphoesterase [Brevibacillus centrosporus]MED1953756.1 metallophosphoesterase [Brevibacillus centrosporus]